MIRHNEKSGVVLNQGYWVYLSNKSRNGIHEMEASNNEVKLYSNVKFSIL